LLCEFAHLLYRFCRILGGCSKHFEKISYGVREERSKRANTENNLPVRLLGRWSGPVFK